MQRLTIVIALLCCAGMLGCTANKNPVANTPPKPLPSESEPRESSSIDWSRLDSTSLRNPNDGSLRDGVPLPLSAPGLRFNPTRDPSARYGTVEVARALVQAAARVDRELGGVPVIINDLSLESGGPIPHHRSHQSGRDVDVLFYQLGPEGAPIESVGAFFDATGKGVDFNDLADPSDDVALTLDLPRTWLFLQALIENETALLQSIYVAEHVRTLLLEHAREISAPAVTVARFEDMSCQPSYPHDDHFHFRFFCTPDDIAKGCRDSPPIYDWHRERLAAAGVRPRPLAPKRKAAVADVVTHEEARRAAGPMDAEVIRWLDLRKAWLDKPHPGRPYCP